jgi:transcription antitermination factor NusG
MFNPGDEATILDGPFMGFMAEIVEAIGLHSAKVIIRSFENRMPATMNVNSLRAA